MKTEIMVQSEQEKEKEEEQPARLYCLSRKTKHLTTLAVFLGNICLGITYNSLAPALVDLKNKYETSMDEISIVFTIIAIAYLIGTLAAGFASNFIKRQLGVIILLSGMAASLYLTPHCPSKSFLFCVGGLLGFSCGAYDVYQVVWTLEMWQADAAPYIQGQYFCISLGGLLSSFLIAQTEIGRDSNGEGVSPRNYDMSIPFTAAGGLVTLTVFYHTFLFAFNPCFPPLPEAGRVGPDPPNDKEVNYSESSDESEESPLIPLKPKRNYRRIKLIILSALFLGADQGMEMCTTAFLPTFAQYGGLRLSEKEGSYFLSGLNAGKIAGQGIGILVILLFPAKLILWFNLLIIGVANVILLLFAGTSVTMLWAGVIGLGFGFSAICPGFTAYIERHLLYTNAVSSIVLVFGSSVGAIYPVIVGKWITENSKVLTYTNFFSLLWMLVAASFLFKMTRKKEYSLPILE